MADNDQQPQQRYWFPYWSGQPQQPPPPVRPQMSRRPSAPVTPSSPRRASSQHHQPSRGGAAAPPSPPAQAPQVSRPSPSRASPLAPIREPPPRSTSNSNAGAAAPPAKPHPRPVAPLAAREREAAPKLKDVEVVAPKEKSVLQQPAAADIKPHGKATDDKEHKAPKDKEETKSKEKVKEKEKEKKEKEKQETKRKEKEKEKEEETKRKEKKEKEEEKEKEKKHHVGDDSSKHKEIKAGMEDSSEKKSHHEKGKLHNEIKAGVADMVHKASGRLGHERAVGSSSVITLAGENKGASMKVAGAGATGKEGLHGHGRRLDSRDDFGKATAAGEGGRGKQGAMRALVNSNVQVINNSLLLQSRCKGGDPGVHLKLSAKSKSKDKQPHAADMAASTTCTAAAKK